MSFQTLLVETNDGVTLIRLNRPEALNALNSKLLKELCQALDAAEADTAVGCVVITGSEKAFAAGADITEMASKSYPDMVLNDLFIAATRRITGFEKPIIAAVAGFALGGGCELAMLCDFIIAAETAKFGQPEINLGIMPGMGGSQRLTRLVGKSKAMDMCLTARQMDAAEAERSGLASRVVPADKLIDEALDAAKRIARQAPLAVRFNKNLVNAAYETTLSAGLEMERRVFQSLFALEDQKEGMAAFVEKRKPSFKGK
jgi:enoyl-CoA hydratase/carnithine racemase